MRIKLLEVYLLFTRVTICKVQLREQFVAYRWMNVGHAWKVSL